MKFNCSALDPVISNIDRIVSKTNGFVMIVCIIYTAIASSMLILILQSSSLQSKIVHLSIKNFDYQDDLNRLFLESKKYIYTFSECKELSRFEHKTNYFNSEVLHFYNDEERLMRITLKTSTYANILHVKQVYWLFKCDKESDSVIERYIHHIKQW